MYAGLFLIFTDMKRTILFILLLILAAGCSPRIVEHVRTEIEYRDSLIVKDSIIYVQLPDEHSSSHIQATDTSRLETSLAESSAWVDSTGLHHTLQNKRKPIGVTVPVITHIVVDRARTDNSQVITQQVERPLTFWQRFRMGAFWYLCAAVVILLLWTFRKPLLALVKP